MSNVSSVFKRYNDLIERFGEEKLNQCYIRMGALFIWRGREVVSH